ENAGEIRLKEMHDPERAKKCAQSNPRAGAQQGGQDDKIKERIRGKQENVFEFSHCPTRPRAAQTRRKGSRFARCYSEAVPNGIQDSRCPPASIARTLRAKKLQGRRSAGNPRLRRPVPGILYAVP